MEGLRGTTKPLLAAVNDNEILVLGGDGRESGGLIFEPDTKQIKQ